MSVISEMCSICLKYQDNLISSEESNHDKIKWILKLSTCVPELEWNADCLLCQACIQKLQTVYEFRKLCLRSYEIRKKKNSDPNVKYDSDSSTNNFDASDYGEDYRTKCEALRSTNGACNDTRQAEKGDSSGDAGQVLLKTKDLILNKKFKMSKLRTIKNCQCKICGIVLDGRKSLFLHNRGVHEKEGISTQSTTIGRSDITKDAGGVNGEDFNTNLYICFHCSKGFPDKLTLIDHIEFVHSCKPEEEMVSVENQVGATKTNGAIEKYSTCLTICPSDNLLVHEHSTNCDGPKRHGKSAQELEVNTCTELLKTETNENLKTSRIDVEKTVSEQKRNEETILQKILTENRADCLKENEAKHKDLRMRRLEKPKLKRGRKPLEKGINKCEICSVIFSTKYLLNRHVRNVHATEKLHNCDICGQKFASPVYLSAHKRYHSRERPHICSFCGKGYITASDLYHHEKIHANKRAYKCEKCPKAFNTSSDLHKHKICVHIDRSQWKYVCTFCDRRFPLKTNLDTHTKTHTGERNFACHLCDRRCINRSVLLRHIESHSNVRLFRCNVCNQDYKYQKSLDIHMTKAHGIGDAKIPERTKKYFCHICPKSYFANNKLQKHIRTHTGERPFSCHLCDKRFIDKSYVKQHLKMVHNISFLNL